MRLEEKLTNHCILVVDDNQDAALLLSRLLQLKGFEVHTRYGGRAALEAAEQLRPKAVVMDLAMPELDGYQTARLLREQIWGQDLVLIALSGHGQEEDRQSSQASGFDSHLTKPVNFQALVSLLS